MTQQERTFEKEITRTVRLNYLLFLPENYSKTPDRWPFTLFLHGAGERGDNLGLVKKHGIPKIVEAKPGFPFIAVSPQCPRDTSWREPLMLNALEGLLDEIVHTCRVDTDRIYLTGLSMGGFGTWGLAARDPGRFAAIAPICGGGDPEQASKLKPLPIWIFHGAKDKVVNPRRSEEMYDALKACGADVKFTLYPEAGHDSWTETYHNPELYDWLLSHSRGK